MKGSIHPSEDLAFSQQQVRLRMRALVEPLSGAIIDSADRIRAGTTNRIVRREALQWKIEAVSALREALFRPNPYVALMDTWALTWQMSDYFEAGRGKAIFGAAAPIGVSTSQYVEGQIEAVAESLTHSRDVSDAREFARKWAKEHPIQHSIAGRESTLSRINERDLQEVFSSAEVIGSVMVTLDDLNRRLDVYSVQLLEQSRWQAELLAMDLAYDYRLDQALPLAERASQSTSDAVAILEQLATPITEALAVASSTPDLVDHERVAAISAAQEEMAQVRQFIHTERVAASQQVLTESRRALAEERKLLTADLEQIGLRLVDRAFLRFAQVTGLSLIVLFVGFVMLLFIDRRFFSGGTKANGLESSRTTPSA